MTHSDEDEMTKVHIWRWNHWALSYILAVVLIVLVLGFVLRDWNLLRRLLAANPAWLAGVFLMLAAGLAAQTVFLGILTNELGRKIAWNECFRLVAAANMVSMLAPPATGGAYRAFYLRNRHGIGILPFVGGTTLYTIIGMLVWCVAGAIGLAGSGLLGNGILKSLLFTTLLVVSVLIATWRTRAVFRLISRDPAARLTQVVDERFRIALSRRVGTAAAVILLLSAPVQILGFCLVLHLFGLTVAINDGDSILAFQQLSSVIGMTPGSIGIQEGAGLLVSRELGLDVAEMAAALSLIRVARVGMSSLVGGVCWWSLHSGSSLTCPPRGGHDFT